MGTCCQIQQRKVTVNITVGRRVIPAGLNSRQDIIWMSCLRVELARNGSHIVAVIVRLKIVGLVNNINHLREVCPTIKRFTVSLIQKCVTT